MEVQYDTRRQGVTRKARSTGASYSSIVPTYGTINKRYEEFGKLATTVVLVLVLELSIMLR